MELIAQWRESGEWWSAEQPQEIIQYRDAKGVRRENIEPLSAVMTRVEAERPKKTRDEKAALALGELTLSAPTILKSRARSYVPLHLQSGYSFGHSILLATEIPHLLAELGLPSAALVDRTSLAGAYEFVLQCKKNGIKPLVGASFEMEEGGVVCLIAKDKIGYSQLCQLITECHLSEPRLYPLCNRRRLETYSRGLLCLTGGDIGRLDRLLISNQYAAAKEWLDFLIGLYGRNNVFVEHDQCYLPWSIKAGQMRETIAKEFGLIEVAGGAIQHRDRTDFPAQDLVLCAETLCRVDEIIGRKPQRHESQPQLPARPVRALNAERFLASTEEVLARYATRPELIENTFRVSERCDPDVLPGTQPMPHLSDCPARDLRERTRAGALQRHKTFSQALERRLERELNIITRLGYADHFLVATDFCDWATQKGYLCSGRGSVVDSAVAYCLGLSRIDAFAHRLHFDRFLPEDGTKRPDIDLDFEAKHRDDVRQYMIAKYGRDHVAAVAAFGAYNTRGIVRQAGKALGIPDSLLGFLSKRIHGGVSPEALEAALLKKPELRGSNIPKERFQWLFRIAPLMTDVPQSHRLHSSGVVVCSRPICEVVPVVNPAEGNAGEGLRLMQWDKRSAKYCFDKFDLLCLRGQDVLAGTQERIRITSQSFDVEQIPLDDEEVFRTIRAGQLIGIPQSASPAMRQAHMRLRTQDLNDTSLVQAGIRPGVGGAVKINELIARRRGKPFAFAHPDLEEILGHTYGIIVFQEQVDQLLQIICGYTSGEAEEIRDAIHKRRREDYGQTIRDELISRARERGYQPEVAQQAFEMVAGFKGYGFAQGHALAFAEISIRSIFCQQNFPAEYFSSLLDAQPAGYYGPYTLANEARIRGVIMLPPCIQTSKLRFTVEDVRSQREPYLILPSGGIRVALTQVSGLSKETQNRIVEQQPYRSLDDFCARAKPDILELESLILCGALDEICPHRKAMMWAARPALLAARAQVGDLPFDHPPTPLDLTIPDFSEIEKAMDERRILDLDVRRHLMAFERKRVESKGGLTNVEATQQPIGSRVLVVGNPIRLRFPPTSSGKRVCFFDLEDETGLLNVTAFDDAYQKYGHAFVCNPFVSLVGEIQDRDGVPAFLLHRAYPYKPGFLADLPEDRSLPLAVSDFLVG